jgi:hypothetical protein
MRFDCESGRKGAEQAGRKLMDSGEASTMEEALSLNGRRGYSAALQKLISSGEATTMDEAGIAFSANARKAYMWRSMTKKSVVSIPRRAMLCGVSGCHARMLRGAEHLEVAQPARFGSKARYFSRMRDWKRKGKK